MKLTDIEMSTEPKPLPENWEDLEDRRKIEVVHVSLKSPTSYGTFKSELKVRSLMGNRRGTIEYLFWHPELVGSKPSEIGQLRVDGEDISVLERDGRVHILRGDLIRRLLPEETGPRDVKEGGWLMTAEEADKYNPREVLENATHDRTLSHHHMFIVAESPEDMNQLFVVRTARLVVEGAQPPQDIWEDALVFSMSSNPAEIVQVKRGLVYA